MFWGGWLLMSPHIGAYFEAGDFAEIRTHFQLWIWMYRIHLFGMVTGVIALISLGSYLTRNPARVMAWPGTGVASAGIFVAALAAAFYYHHGAWGALETQGKSVEEVEEFIAKLRVDTEYVTCLVRFGRVFSGVGFLVFGLSILKWAFVPRPLGALASFMGLAAIAVTMLWPDHWSLYTPIFHMTPLWFIAMGVAILRSGIQSSEA